MGGERFEKEAGELKPWGGDGGDRDLREGEEETDLWCAVLHGEDDDAQIQTSICELRQFYFVRVYSADGSGLG